MSSDSLAAKRNNRRWFKPQLRMGTIFGPSLSLSKIKVFKIMGWVGGWLTPQRSMKTIFDPSLSLSRSKVFRVHGVGKGEGGWLTPQRSTGTILDPSFSVSGSEVFSVHGVFGMFLRRMFQS